MGIQYTIHYTHYSYRKGLKERSSAFRINRGLLKYLMGGVEAYLGVNLLEGQIYTRDIHTSTKSDWPWLAFQPNG